MNLLQKLEAWFAAIWHHFHAGTLPDPPSAGNPATLPPVDPGVVTPPAPPITGAPPTTWPSGITLIDSANGLVRIDAAEAVFPGKLYAVAPSLPRFDPQSQAYATVAYNTSYGASADQGLGMHIRVNTMVPVSTPTGIAPKFTNSNPYQWIANAYTIGSEFDTWPKAIERAVFVAGNLAKAAANPNTPFAHP